jgi:hypothetical protein
MARQWSRRSPPGPGSPGPSLVVDPRSRDPSQRSLDPPTTPSGHCFRPRVPFHHPRPRRDLFLRVRCVCGRSRPRSHKDSSSQPEGQFAVRKVNRDTAARVSGLDCPVDRGASAKNSAVLVSALQPRPATLLLGARPSRSTAKFPRAYATPSASFRPAKPNCGSLRPERTSSRVRPLASRCTTVVGLWRTTMRRDSLKEQ